MAVSIHKMVLVIDIVGGGLIIEGHVFREYNKHGILMKKVPD